jgi:thioredoxin-like negative regulator of GroEL
VQSALPPPLTPANFKSTVEKGLWYVEHYSPHCWHCQQFMPMWEELVKLNDNGEFPGMHMAQVDCAVNGGERIGTSERT